jgi:hypothetical protein
MSISLSIDAYDRITDWLRDVLEQPEMADVLIENIRERIEWDSDKVPFVWLYNTETKSGDVEELYLADDEWKPVAP